MKSLGGMAGCTLKAQTENKSNTFNLNYIILNNSSNWNDCNKKMKVYHAPKQLTDCILR
jgi:hypothetical protein